MQLDVSDLVTEEVRTVGKASVKPIILSVRRNNSNFDVIDSKVLY
jgi:hypothetical protein